MGDSNIEDQVIEIAKQKKGIFEMAEDMGSEKALKKMFSNLMN